MRALVKASSFLCGPCPTVAAPSGRVSGLVSILLVLNIISNKYGQTRTEVPAMRTQVCLGDLFSTLLYSKSDSTHTFSLEIR